MIEAAIICTGITVGMIGKIILTDVRAINEELRLESIKPTIEQKLDLILKLVSEQSQIPIEDIVSKRRYRPITVARQISQFLMVKLYESEDVQINYKLISQKTNRDRTAIYHSCNVINDAIEVRDKDVLRILKKCVSAGEPSKQLNEIINEG